MSDYRDLLEQERRRFRMPEGSLRSLERRRDRKRRNRQFAAGVLALLIAAAGVGGGLFALRSSTGQKPAGQTPTPTPTGGPGVELAMPSPVSGRLQFIDDLHGWAVVQGQVLATSDGGKTWSPQYTGPDEIQGLTFVDANHGWAVSPGRVLRTTDGGANWDPTDEPSFGFSEVQFQDDQIGWGIRLDLGPDVRRAGTLVKTTDGGVTWDAVPGVGQVESMCFADPMNGWAAGGISLQRTTNGGHSWTGGPLAEFPQGEPWTATVRCAPNGKEAFVLVQDGGAAGHIAYVAYQATDDGQGRYGVQFVLQEAGTHPLGPGYGSVYNSEDPYPGPFTVVGPGSAYFLGWCPACGGSLPAVSITITAGQPAEVTDRFPVGVGDLPGQPLGVTFQSPEGSESLPMRGWALVELSGEEGLSHTIYETEDGGRTWTEVPILFGP